MPISRASNPLDTVVRAKVGNTGTRHSALGRPPLLVLLRLSFRRSAREFDYGVLSLIGPDPRTVHWPKADSRTPSAAFLLPLALNVGQITSKLGVSEAVANDIGFLDDESHVIGLEGNSAGGLFVDEGGQFHGRCAPSLNRPHEEFGRLPRLNHAFDEQNVLALHVDLRTVVNLNLRCRSVHSFSLRLNKMEDRWDGDRSNEVGAEDEPIWKDADQREVLSRIIAGNLLTHFSYTSLNLLGAEQDFLWHSRWVLL